MRAKMVRGLLPAGGFGWRERCARSTFTGCGKWSSPSNLGINWETNFVFTSLLTLWYPHDLNVVSPGASLQVQHFSLELFVLIS